MTVRSKIWRTPAAKTYKRRWLPIINSPRHYLRILFLFQATLLLFGYCSFAMEDMQLDASFRLSDLSLGEYPGIKTISEDLFKPAYKAAFSQFDPDMRRISGQLEISHETLGSCMFLLTQLGLEDNMAKASEDKCVYDPVRINDLSTHFAVDGAHLDRMITWESKIRSDELATKAKEFKSEADGATPFSLILRGNPARFPFDRYLVVFDVEQEGVVVKKNGTVTKLVDSGNPPSVEFDVPGFVATNLDESGASQWGSSPSLSSSPKAKGDFDEKDFWARHVICFEFQRSLFTRILTMVVWGAALFSIIVVTATTGLEDLLKTLGVSLLSLWAFHGFLAGASPKIPTIWDYSVVLLFAVQVIAVIFRMLGRMPPLSVGKVSLRDKMGNLHPNLMLNRRRGSAAKNDRPKL